MKRYEMVYEGGHNGELVQAPNGEWVQYADYAAREGVLQKDHAVLLAHYHAAAQRHAEVADDLQRQLAEVTAERDLARTELSIADAHRKDLSRTLDVANATIDFLRGIARC